MTVKERLHRLVDALPESEANAAARYLEYLASSTDPVALALALAPDDDEPVTDEERAALAERETADRSIYVPLDEVKRTLGL